jgi:hypothetical protein
MLKFKTPAATPTKIPERIGPWPTLGRTARLWTDASISLSTTLLRVQVNSVCGRSKSTFYSVQTVYSRCERGVVQSSVFLATERIVFSHTVHLWTDLASACQ